MKKYTIETFARAALLACATDDGFIAGVHHFVDLWARDSLFATLGANVSGLSHVSKKTIETFLFHQRHDGLVPFCIRRSRMTPGKYFGRHTYFPVPRAQFRSGQSGGTVPDGGLMSVIAARAYAQASSDMIFVKKYSAQFERAMRWYTGKFGDGLIREWFQCEWADAVLKVGSTLYTNVLYWKAAGDLAWLLKKAGKSKESKTWTDLQTHIGTRIRTHLWTGEYFADWKHMLRHDYFASHGNMLAIVFGLATKREAVSILSFAAKYAWNGKTLETNVPSYPWWRIPVQNYITGTADYHNHGCLWLQPGILYAMALNAAGQTGRARSVFDSISSLVLSHETVYEVYERNGTPVRRTLYRSEGPFAWSAGLLLAARVQLGNI